MSGAFKNNFYKDKFLGIILKAFNHNVIKFEPGQWMLYFVILSTFEYNWISTIEEVDDGWVQVLLGQ
jgi:hypothetical protein